MSETPGMFASGWVRSLDTAQPMTAGGHEPPVMSDRFAAVCQDLLPALRPRRASRATQPSLGSACRGSQDAAGVETGVTAFGGWVPSDLRRFLPLAVLRTCLAEMVLLPTRFFFASAISILLSKEAEDTWGADAHASYRQLPGAASTSRCRPLAVGHE